MACTNTPGSFDCTVVLLAQGKLGEQAASTGMYININFLVIANIFFNRYD